MVRKRDLKLPREKLPEPLANALRLFGYNWQSRRSRDGKLWTIYLRGKPGATRKKWALHSNADPEWVVQWLSHREFGRTPLNDRFLMPVSTTPDAYGL